MHVVVVTKSTPDKEAKIEVKPSGEVNWGGEKMYINPWDEYSVTEAIQLKQDHGVKVTVITVGPELHNEALKDALARGADEALRVWDEGMEGQDNLGYAQAVAAAVRKLGDVSLVIFGKEFMDTATDAHIFQTARKLGWPALGSYQKILAADFNAKTITVEQYLEEGRQTVTGTMPAVLGVAQDINEPKTPTLMGIRKAAKATIPVWSSADLGLNSEAAGSAAQAKITGFENLPVWQGTVELIEGGSEQEKAEKLVAKLIEEKVIS